MIAAEPESLSSLGFLLRDAIDKEVMLAALALIGCHEFYGRVDGEHETCDIALMRHYVSDWPVLVRSKDVVLLLSFSISNQ